MSLNCFSTVTVSRTRSSVDKKPRYVWGKATRRIWHFFDSVAAIYEAGKRHLSKRIPFGTLQIESSISNRKNGVQMREWTLTTCVSRLKLVCYVPTQQRSVITLSQQVNMKKKNTAKRRLKRETRAPL